MSRNIRNTFLTIGALLVAAPAAAFAQAGGAGAGPQRPMPPAARGARGAQGPEAGTPIPPMDATALLNARRALDLSPRQVAQLDSIERSLFSERQAMQARMRTMQDSVRTRAMRSPDGRPAMNPDSMRARMEALRPQMEQMRRRDSTSRAAAERVLNDSQRQKVREMQAEERGRQRGLREARARSGGGVRGGGRGNARGGARGGVRGGAQAGPRRPMPPDGRPAPDSARRRPDDGR
ncbi:MAG: hypothetical protein OEW77_06565 [Gemmatimonadota bacterium]|nr:hypothetical protein [Gemmatimonadota bacterium]